MLTSWRQGIRRNSLNSSPHLHSPLGIRPSTDFHLGMPQ
uniref:Uncharacterized protein n=1 Tax=Ascaris lumbricoides TaxID=6252 RepID=A0A0M3ITB3_ASCLU